MRISPKKVRMPKLPHDVRRHTSIIRVQVDWNRVGNDIMVWLHSISAEVSTPHIFATIKKHDGPGVIGEIVKTLVKLEGRGEAEAKGP